MKPTLSIVILAYREAPEVLAACFRSVAASIGVSFETTLVDNGNRQETRRLLMEHIPNATYLANTENRGFAAAVNQGVRASHGRYVLLLNPDTVIGPDVLVKMLAHMDTDTDVGIGSCRIVYPDGSPQESIRRFPTLANRLAVMLKLPHMFPKLVSRYMMRDVNPAQTQDVESIMGAFMVIRRELLETIGFLDERYFIWFEEVDYCKMAHDAGWKIRHYADVEIVHHKGHTFAKLATIRKQKWIRQSMRKYIRKHHGWLPWFALWVLAPLFVVLGYGAALIKRQ